MLIQLQNFLTFENLYLWTNFGVLPFWLMLIFFPNSKITQIFVNSIILPIILASFYCYVIYQIILLGEPVVEIIKLYTNFDDLYTRFATESFLLLFWIHYVTLNLFLGSWVSRDAVKYGLPRSLVFVPLVLIYFIGPVGLVLYWVIRIFYAKRLGFHD